MSGFANSFAGLALNPGSPNRGAVNRCEIAPGPRIISIAFPFA
jgi:hypothetical protein